MHFQFLFASDTGIEYLLACSFDQACILVNKRIAGCDLFLKLALLYGGCETW